MILLQIKCFALIFAILVIFDKIMEIVRVVRLKEGKVNTSNIAKIVLGVCISYTITCLIYGL